MRRKASRWSAVTAAALALVLAAAAAGPACAEPASGPSALQPAVAAMRPEAFLHTVQDLASDDFEGRSVGTRGGEITQQYLEDAFRRIGLAPGSPDGSYRQHVPLSGHSGSATTTVHARGKALALQFRRDIVAGSYERAAHVEVKGSELVFVGYGVVAPEYDWDDFKGLDVRGKTLVVLINDPQIPDPADPSRLDERMFKGRGMTLYGRWTYKYEMAAARGAAAMLIVHETKTAAYPWEVVVNSFSHENFDIDSGAVNADFPRIPAWITTDKTRAVFALAGKDFDALKKAALRRDFHPVPLGATIDIGIDKRWRDIRADNIVGRIDGSDPALRDQVVVYTAHWDHFGWNPALPGSKTDQIFHGALDNASGVAALLELAKAYRALPQPPRRSVLFMATTAEEQGLLGAQYYVSHPLFPLRKTVADINMDGMNVHGRTRDVEVKGYGNSELEDILAVQAAAQGRTVVPDQTPENGSYFRADHFKFAGAGVPALYFRSGVDFIGQPPSYGHALIEHYVAHDYHKPTDIVRADWDLSGAMEDLELLFRVGHAAAQADVPPAWKAGSEFKAKGDSR